MVHRDIIVIGTSAGGAAALAQVVRGLPAGFPASLFIVCHLQPGAVSVLPEILSRAGPLLASHPADGEPFYPGHIYVAPPDHHLLLGPDGQIRVTRDPHENNHRPAVDPLFRSAARYYGRRVIGVILTGALYDGTAGLLAVRAAGGLAVVQDPQDAVVGFMPQNAAQIAGADYVVPLADVIPLLTTLVYEHVPSDRGAEPMDPFDQMPEIVAQDFDRQISNERRGGMSIFTCPECGGSLWQVDDVGMVRFRCHVGHVYRGEVLLSEQDEALEAALWTAVRTFREKAALAMQLAIQERGAGNAAVADRFERQAAEADRFGRLIQQHLLENRTPDGSQGDVTAVPDGAR